jgi:hypothetical protein
MYTEQQVTEVTRSLLLECKERLGCTNTMMADKLDIPVVGLARWLNGHEQAPMWVLLNALELVGGEVTFKVALPPKPGVQVHEPGLHLVELRPVEDEPKGLVL